MRRQLTGAALTEVNAARTSRDIVWWMCPHLVLRKLTWTEVFPTVRTGAIFVALFGLGMVLAREFQAPIERALGASGYWAMVAFVATSVIAVLLPIATNLPLIPLVVHAWGPWWTAILLLVGWVGGASLSFLLARRIRSQVLRCFPLVLRHADIDRLIEPQHRMLSLVLLRMTFPVDVLSYALGLFSRATTANQNAMSTLLGAAPFALGFALFPALSWTAQWLVFGACALAFAGYVAWITRRLASGGTTCAGR